MTGVMVTGARGPLGRRVCHRLAGDPTVTTLLRTDSVPGTTVAELKELLDGVGTIVHLGPSSDVDLDGTGTGGVDVEATRRLLEAAGSSAVETLVLLSTAMVYGAWSNNPVPLTEDAPLRPNPELPFAVGKAEVERLALEWSAGHPGTRVAILRPTISVSEDTANWMARSLWSTGAVAAEDVGPPAQFLDIDDLAAAVDLARRETLEGVFNVAPDGWVPAEQVRELAGPGRRVRLPETLATRVARLRWSVGLTPTPPEVLPYTVHPWVIANDRLRATGWKPVSSNEEAFVAAVEVGPLQSMNPRRRQEVALGVVGAVLVAAVATVVFIAVRRRRRR